MLRLLLATLLRTPALAQDASKGEGIASANPAIPSSPPTARPSSRAARPPQPLRRDGRPLAATDLAGTGAPATYVQSPTTLAHA